MFNKTEFKIASIRAGMTYKQIAEKLGIDESTLYRKINADGAFTRNEISEIIQMLDIKNPMDIFFDEKLADTQEGSES